MICDCLLPVTTLTALEHNAGDIIKIQESYATLRGEIRARGRVISQRQAPALPGSLGHLGLEPFTHLPGGTWLCPPSMVQLQSWEHRAERPRAANMGEFSRLS